MVCSIRLRISYSRAIVIFAGFRYLKPISFIFLRRVDSVSIGKSDCSACRRGRTVVIFGYIFSSNIWWKTYRIVSSGNALRMIDFRPTLPNFCGGVGSGTETKDIASSTDWCHLRWLWEVAVNDGSPEMIVVCKFETDHDDNDVLVTSPLQREYTLLSSCASSLFCSCSCSACSLSSRISFYKLLINRIGIPRQAWERSNVLFRGIPGPYFSDSINAIKRKTKRFIYRENSRPDILCMYFTKRWQKNVWYAFDYKIRQEY